ncbi:ribonuclease P protein component [Rariglobus hedericola]|nr:ribonuclease P protein component [Rariglobus hedericola]
MRFRAEQHLRRQLDFQHVRTHGRRHDCGAFMLWYARQAAPIAPVAAVPAASTDAVSPDGATPAETAPRSRSHQKKSASGPIPARVGVVASKSAVGNAVQRARAKRRLREAFRQHQLRVPAGYDLLLVARSSLNRLEYREIERRFADACLKIFPAAKA